MKKVPLRIILFTLIGTILFSCAPKNDRNSTLERIITSESDNDSEEIADPTLQIPQIIMISKSPERLTKEVNAYSVTLITEERKVALKYTEFSLDGKDWQKSTEFKNITCGKHTFYARNKRNKSLQDQKEMYFECYVDVQLPTIPKLNEYLRGIASCDDKASDELRKFGKDLPVRGIANVDNIEQLIRNACMNEVIYVVEKIETDQNGDLVAIIIQTK